MLQPDNSSATASSLFAFGITRTRRFLQARTNSGQKGRLRSSFCTMSFSALDGRVSHGYDSPSKIKGILLTLVSCTQQRSTQWRCEQRALHWEQQPTGKLQGRSYVYKLAYNIQGYSTLWL